MKRRRTIANKNIPNVDDAKASGEVVVTGKLMFVTRVRDVLQGESIGANV